MKFLPVRSFCSRSAPVPLVRSSAIMGMVTEGNLMAMLLKKRVKATDPVSKVRALRR